MLVILAAWALKADAFSSWLWGILGGIMVSFVSAMPWPVEIIGLAPGLEASVAPASVDVILTGPVPVLNALGPTDVRVVVDLSGYDVGTYQLIPQVNILPERVQKVSMLPATVEATITVAPTPAGTPTPAQTPTPTRT
jgi:hypothetical protein